MKKYRQSFLKNLEIWKGFYLTERQTLGDHLNRAIVVAIGSTNPTKVNAVKVVFKRVWKNASIKKVQVSSGVSPQPFGAKEIVSGATTRAKMALRKINADFGVGIEGGVARFGAKWYNLGFVVIVDRDGRLGMGSSGWFECPPRILRELRRGRELGEVMDELTGEKDTKRGGGAIGIFTKGEVSRQKLYEHGVWMALCTFISPELFR